MPAETLFQTEVKTRLGIYTAVLSARGLVRLLWPGDKCASVAAKIDAGSPKKIAGLAKRIAAQLVAYHCGEKIKFNLPLDLSGQTDFRQRVWRRMLEIPYGQTMTYGEIAEAVGCRSARAVGQACGANPLPVIIPCHRVVAAGGLGGWSGKKSFKEKLLRIEEANCPR